MVLLVWHSWEFAIQLIDCFWCFNTSNYCIDVIDGTILQKPKNLVNCWIRLCWTLNSFCCCGLTDLNWTIHTSLHSTLGYNLYLKLYRIVVIACIIAITTITRLENVIVSSLDWYDISGMCSQVWLELVEITDALLCCCFTSLTSLLRFALQIHIWLLALVQTYLMYRDNTDSDF